MKNKLQIAVFGSTADLKYSLKIKKIAEEVGYWIAKSGGVLIFGFEKDTDSLSTAAFRGAKKASGLTVGVTYGKRTRFKEEPDVLITSGMERGGGREYVLAANCDVAIAISGGSGTLNEIAVAYQLNIPIVAVLNTGGWASKLADKYIDQRKRFKIMPAKTAKEAVELAFKLAKKNL